MNFKLKGNTLLNGDIVSPDIPYAEFSGELGPDVKHRIVAALNHGHDMLLCYMQHRDNLSISNCAKMIEEMETIYSRWENKVYDTNRKYNFNRLT